jgi:hypothetical protein
VEDVSERLARQGHRVEPLDVELGTDAKDRFVDPPPYHHQTADAPDQVKHLRLNLWGYAATSIALIATSIPKRTS